MAVDPTMWRRVRDVASGLDRMPVECCQRALLPANPTRTMTAAVAERENRVMTRSD
jgi:hypothetical protein